MNSIPKILLLIAMLTSGLSIHAQSVNYEKAISEALTQKDTLKAVKILLVKLKTPAPLNPEGMEILGTNNQIFNLLFKHSTKKKHLLTAAAYMEKIINTEPGAYGGIRSLRANFIDTYANLLYKAGQPHQAMQWEFQACLDAADGQKNEFKANLEKMRQGLPTW